MLKKADLKLPNNCDLKTKLAQMLYREQYPAVEGIKYITELFALQEPDPMTLQLLAKLLIRQRDGVQAVEQVEKAL